jgi:hypothetical protein
MAYTVAYQPSVDGFTSFYSGIPEMMIGMNNYFYTFKNGQIWKEYLGIRGNYYGTQYGSSIRISQNSSPNEVKIFKTISFTGDITEGEISSSLMTAYLGDRAYTGYISANEFVNKEGELFCSIRNNSEGTAETGSTMVDKGVGVLAAIKATNSYEIITNESLTIITGINSTSGTTLFYYSGTTLNVIGYISSMEKTNSGYIINTYASALTPTVGSIIGTRVSSKIESYGLRGNYNILDININSTNTVELFSVQSNIIKSFP